METALTTDQLRHVLELTLSPNAEQRKKAEEELERKQRVTGHAMVVLELVASNATNPAVRQSAAVHFKNLVKKGWRSDADAEDLIALTPDQRQKIQSHLVQLMSVVPPTIQSQCSESIALMAASDYPEKWDSLLPELVVRMGSSDLEVVNGCLKTADSIFRSFRYIQRTNELYAKILYTLKHFQEPLLNLMKGTMAAIIANPNDKPQLVAHLTALRTMCEIFYSLIWQDLPEFFEDHMNESLDIFAKCMEYKNQNVEDPGEEDEPSVVDRLQASVVQILFLYGDKDEEPFIPHVQKFTQLIWDRLMSVTAFKKHDELTAVCIRFLSSLVQKQMHKSVFEVPQVLEQIIEKIVIPNLIMRDSDEELFEDDAAEFMATDLEGAESDSRRKCAQGLLKNCGRQFLEKSTEIAKSRIATLMDKYKSNPQQEFRAKDAAIHLLLGISIQAESDAGGVTQINSGVDVLQFFGENIFPELQNPSHPMLTATCIKFVSTFRNQFSKEHLVSLMPLLIHHLTSQYIVVHTYAAFSIEKILGTKQNGLRKLEVTDLQQYLENLFTNLFGIIDNTTWNENAYAMKALMRMLVIMGEGILPVTQEVLNRLTAALGRVAKNPRNPQYNHYLFESISILVSSVCRKDPNLTANFESLLFPPFQHVLQMDVSEFTPYVFQVLAQILEFRPEGLGEAYTTLFPPLLTPAIWNRGGNVPALTRLLRAYLEKASPDFLVPNLQGMLGIFQKLVASSKNEMNGFDLLTSITLHMPPASMNDLYVTVYQVLLTRLQGKGTPRYKRCITNYFCLWTGKFGGQAWISLLDRLQAGLGMNLIGNIWLKRYETDLPRSRMEVKVALVGLCKLMAAISSDSMATAACATVLIKLLSGEGVADAKDEDVGAPIELEVSSDSTFNTLQFARRAAVDPFADVANVQGMVAQTLRALPVCPTLADPKDQTQLQTLLRSG